MTSSQVRQAYLDFFAKNGHTIKPSTPIVPQGDPTLMFNSAGMVPFKPYFLGQKTDLSRAASSQKCFRTTDIDRVGHTLRHLTFFEMLGNFSFGDYFKAESIAWAWEFLTKDLGMDPKRLHPSVFKDDEEAIALWKKQGIVHQPVRLGEDSNFWNMGPTGPCGPCSEIYFDLGPERSCGKPGCAVGCDCDRYLEIWNLVFTQFDRQADGSLKPLPRKNIDTGMGLERLCFALSGKPSPFETDLFFPITEKAQNLFGRLPAESPETALAFRVISDHARAASMLVSEGIVPSNVGRGYVLRRLIRRSVRYGQLLGHQGPFLHTLVGAVAGIFKPVSPELDASKTQVAATIRTEEEKFLETLEKGEAELSAMLSKVSGTLAGEQAFKLYETFGFPLELTKEICAKAGVSVDEAGFSKASERASEIARASWKGSGEKLFVVPAGTPKSVFSGYEALELEAEIVAVKPGRPGWVILDRTPFYPEGGGQVGDEGTIQLADGRVWEVLDTQKHDEVIFHVCNIDNASAAKGKVKAKVDVVRRGYISPHHTGTHVLNEALRRLLGPGVRQAGSYVGADKLRFDFTHAKALDPEQLKKVEAMVADEIRRGDRVETKVEAAEKVKEYGAVTLLGETYGERPRFVLIGPKGWDDHKDRFSLELCGGTHVGTTAELEAFKIVKESSVAAGVRRIEALAGRAVADYEAMKARERDASRAQLREKERALLDEVHALGGKAEPSSDSADESALRLREKELRELLGRLRSKKAAAAAPGKLLDVKGLKLMAQRLEGADPKSLRPAADKLKGELGSGLVFLGAPQNGKLSFVLAATPDLAGKGVDAARIAKAFASAHGGSAGGRADFAQGGVADAAWDSLVDSLSRCV